MTFKELSIGELFAFYPRRVREVSEKHPALRLKKVSARKYEVTYTTGYIMPCHITSIKVLVYQD